MIEMRHAGSPVSYPRNPARPQTNPPGTDVEASGRGEVPLLSVPPPTRLVNDPYATQFWTAISRLVRNAVEQGRVPTLAVGVNGSRISKGPSDQLDPLRRVGGLGDDSTDTPLP